MVMAFESLKEMVIQNPLGLQEPQKAVKLDHDSTGNGFHESPQLSPFMILEFSANSQFEMVNSSLPYARYLRVFPVATRTRREGLKTPRNGMSQYDMMCVIHSD